MKCIKLYYFLIVFFSFFNLKISFSLSKEINKKIDLLFDNFKTSKEFEEFERQLEEPSKGEAVFLQLLQESPAKDILLRYKYNLNRVLISDLLSFLNEYGYSSFDEKSYNTFVDNYLYKYSDLNKFSFHAIQDLFEFYQTFNEYFDKKKFFFSNTDPKLPNKKPVRSYFSDKDNNFLTSNKSKNEAPEEFLVYEVSTNNGVISFHPTEKNFQDGTFALAYLTSQEVRKSDAIQSNKDQNFIYVISPTSSSESAGKKSFLTYAHMGQFFQDIRNYFISLKYSLGTKPFYCAILNSQAHIIDLFQGSQDNSEQIFLSKKPFSSVNSDFFQTEVNLSGIHSLSAILKNESENNEKKRGRKIIIKLDFVEPEDKEKKILFEKKVFQDLSHVTVDYEICIEYQRPDVIKNNIITGSRVGIFEQTKHKKLFQEGITIYEGSDMLKNIRPHEVYHLAEYLEHSDRGNVVKKDFVSSEECKKKIQERLDEVTYNFLLQFGKSNKKSILLNKYSWNSFLEEEIKKTLLNVQFDTPDKMLKCRSELQSSYKDSFFTFYQSIIPFLNYKNIFINGVDDREIKVIIHNNDKYELNSKVFFCNQIQKNGCKNTGIPYVFSNDSKFEKMYVEAPLEEKVKCLLDHIDSAPLNELKYVYQYNLYQNLSLYDFDREINFDKELSTLKSPFVDPKGGDNYHYVALMFKNILKNKNDIKEIIYYINRIYAKEKNYYEGIFQNLPKEKANEKNKNIISMIIHRIIFHFHKVPLFPKLNYGSIANLEKKLNEAKFLEETKSNNENVTKVLTRYYFVYKPGIDTNAMPECYKNWVVDLKKILNGRHVDHETEESRLKIIDHIKKHFCKISSLCGIPGTGKSEGFSEMMRRAESILAGSGFDKYIELLVLGLAGFKSSYVSGTAVLINETDMAIRDMNEEARKKNKKVVLIFYADEPEQIFQNSDEVKGNSAASNNELKGGLKEIMSKHDIHLVCTSNDSPDQLKKMLGAAIVDRIVKDGAKIVEINTIPAASLILMLKKKYPNINWDLYRTPALIYFDFLPKDKESAGKRGALTEIGDLVDGVLRKKKVDTDEEKANLNMNLWFMIISEARKAKFKDTLKTLESLLFPRDKGHKDALEMELKKNQLGVAGAELASLATGFFDPKAENWYSYIPKALKVVAGVSTGGGLLGITFNDDEDYRTPGKPFFKTLLYAVGFGVLSTITWNLYNNHKFIGDHNKGTGAVSINEKLKGWMQNRDNYVPFLVGQIIQPALYFNGSDEAGRRAMCHLGQMFDVFGMTTEQLTIKDDMFNRNKLEEKKIPYNAAVKYASTVSYAKLEGISYEELYFYNHGMMADIISYDQKNNNFLDNKQMVDRNKEYFFNLAEEILITNNYPYIKKFVLSFTRSQEYDLNRLYVLLYFCAGTSFDLRKKKLLNKEVLKKLDSECELRLFAAPNNINQRLGQYHRVQNPEEKLRLEGEIKNQLKLICESANSETNPAFYERNWRDWFLNKGLPNRKIPQDAYMNQKDFFGYNYGIKKENPFSEVVSDSLCKNISPFDMFNNLNKVEQNVKKEFMKELLEKKNKIKYGELEKSLKEMEEISNSDPEIKKIAEEEDKKREKEKTIAFELFKKLKL